MLGVQIQLDTTIHERIAQDDTFTIQVLEALHRFIDEAPPAPIQCYPIAQGGSIEVYTQDTTTYVTYKEERDG